MADGKIVVTLKGGAGFEAPWITVGGDTAGEVQQAVDAVLAIGLVGTVQQAADLFRAAGVATTVVPTPTAPATPAPSAPVAPQPDVPGRSCIHGQRKLVNGRSARGAWTGYFCPLQKGDPNQCKPEFVNP